MEHLTDVVITKIYEGPNGEGEWGKWQAYNLYLDKGEKKKFGWMQSGKKIIPKEGMHLKHVGYEVEEDGQYTNYKIKEMELKEGTTATSATTAKEDMGLPNAYKAGNQMGKEINFYVAYAKDIAVAMINGERFEYELLEKIVLSVAKAGKMMMNESMGNGEISSQESKTGGTVDDQYIEQQEPCPTSENDTTDYSGRIDCPNLTDDEGNPKNILKRACQTCSQREGCPAL